MAEDDFVATMVELLYQNVEGYNEILDESNSIIVEDRQEKQQIETEEENSQSEVSKSNNVMFIFATDRMCVISGFSQGI